MNIFDLTKDELEKYFVSAGEKKYRSGQVFKNLYRMVKISDMTDISKPLRNKIESAFEYFIPKIERKLVSKKDFVVKYLFRMSDGEYAEGVVMGYRHGLSMCISTQVGCRMGCRFCASTIRGLKRNLTPGEMSGQIIAARQDLGRRISNIVLMGSGEPFDNWDNVEKFLRNATDADGLGIGARHITLSTCGLIQGIEKLAECGMEINLSISLHAATDEKRQIIMPVAKSVPIERLLRTAAKYTSRTGRRVTYEYSLISGLNDTKNDALELAKFLKGTLSHVNLIPVNEVREREYKKSTKIKEFQRILADCGINATVRRTLGSDINASCGQLRNEFEAQKGGAICSD